MPKIEMGHLRHKFILPSLGGLAISLGMGISQPSKADVYTFVGKSGVSYYAEKPVPGKKSGIPPRPRDVVFTPVAISLLNNSYRFSDYSGADDIDHWVDLAARTHNLDPKLLHAVIAAESSYNPTAVSPKGAAGLMQLMPATAARFNVSDRMDGRENVLGGSQYLKTLLGMFDQDVELALAAYNAGEGAVIRHGRKIPPFLETQTYVAKVLERYRR